MLLDSVISVLLPEVARREAKADYDGIITLWASAVRKLALFFVPIYALLFVVRYEFITTLFTSTYVSAAPIFAINLLNIMLYIFVPTSILRSFDSLKYFRLKLSFAMIPVLAGALFIGIRTAGLAGAITAFVSVQTLDLSIVVFAIGRRLKMSLSDVRRLAPLVRTLIAASVAAGAAIAAKVTIVAAGSFIVLLVSSTAFVTAFLLAAFITGAVTAAEKAEMRGTLLKYYRLGTRRLGLSTAA